MIRALTFRGATGSLNIRKPREPLQRGTFVFTVIGSAAWLPAAIAVSGQPRLARAAIPGMLAARRTLAREAIPEF
jgi:hypothetical protein